MDERSSGPSLWHGTGHSASSRCLQRKHAADEYGTTPKRAVSCARALATRAARCRPSSRRAGREGGAATPSARAGTTSPSQSHARAFYLRFTTYKYRSAAGNVRRRVQSSRRTRAARPSSSVGRRRTRCAAGRRGGRPLLEERLGAAGAASLVPTAGVRRSSPCSQEPSNTARAACNLHRAATCIARWRRAGAVRPVVHARSRLRRRAAARPR